MSTYRTNNQKPRKRNCGAEATKRGATHQPTGFSKLQRAVMKHVGSWEFFQYSSVADRARQRRINELALAHGVSLADSLEALEDHGGDDGQGRPT